MRAASLMVVRAPPRDFPLEDPELHPAPGTCAISMVFAATVMVVRGPLLLWLG
jgi:hypothetical protein